jgi:hypothetical protein
MSPFILQIILLLLLLLMLLLMLSHGKGFHDPSCLLAVVVGASDGVVIE